MNKYKIPQKVKDNVNIYYKLKSLGYDAMTATGKKTASILKNNDYIDEKQYKLMRAWFSRHKMATRPYYLIFKKTHDLKYIKSYMAWNGWGSDDAYNWIMNI